MNYLEKYDNPVDLNKIRVDENITKSLISLVIPTYQEEKIIEEQLKRFPKSLRSKYIFELIVSDGGSSDKTVEIAQNFADRVVVHNADYRQTISEGRNRGAEVSAGDIIVFLNADSYPEDVDKFFGIIRKFADAPINNVAAIACYVSGFPDEIITKDKIFYTLHNFYVKSLNFFGIGMGRGECQVVRRNKFFDVGGYNNSIVAGEDFDLYRRLNKKSKVVFMQDLVVLESPRRFRKYGYIKTIWYWTMNSLTVIFFGKSVSKEWEAVR